MQSLVAMLAVLAAAVVPAAVHPTPAASILTMSDEKAVADHIKFAYAFKCVPRPRALLVHDAVNCTLQTNETLSPHRTVLHRCDAQAGCCFQFSTCKPHVVEPVMLHFYVNSPNSSKTVALLAYNHTQCRCEKILNIDH